MNVRQNRHVQQVRMASRYPKALDVRAMHLHVDALKQK